MWRNNTMGVYDSVALCWRAQTGVGALNGVSDILGILPNGQFLAIEVKQRTGKVSSNQSYFLNKINENGGIAFVARSLEDVKEQLGC